MEANNQRVEIPLEFPLILLQAKAGGMHPLNKIFQSLIVSINSPSGEGGGLQEELYEIDEIYKEVSINSPSGEGGGKIEHLIKDSEMLSGFH